MTVHFDHRSLGLQAEKPLVYTAISKHLFYYRMFISVFVLRAGAIPLNPFMIFDYFLLDAVDRDIMREGNNNLVKRSDELWVFGQVSDGVLAEIQIAKEHGKPVRYFRVEKSQHFTEVFSAEVEMEEDVRAFQDRL